MLGFAIAALLAMPAHAEHVRQQRCVELGSYPAAEAHQGVAVDVQHFYAITNRAIGKYTKSDGRLVARWEAPQASELRHLNSGVVVDGKLYCAHSNWPVQPYESSVEIWDTETLEHIGRRDLTLPDDGAMTWVDRHDDAWWVVFAHYGSPSNVGRSTLVKFDDQWRRIRTLWFAPEVVQRFIPGSNSGGSFGQDGVLHVTGHDRAELYALTIPAESSRPNSDYPDTVTLAATVPANITGQGIAWDRTDPGVLYGIRRSTRDVVVSRLTAQATEPISYQRDVRPILSENCYECHGPDAAQRQAGLRLDVRHAATIVLESGNRAIVPGRANESALIERIRSSDSTFHMPPADSGKSLAVEQIETLARWVDEGAEFSEHWSFVPPTRGASPKVKDVAWSSNPIDRYVLAKLERDGGTPSPPATAEQLIRRVTQDLTGLPPSLSEVDAFLADAADGRYERLVDRLLASPRFGEHRARYWLDAARYGDTHGFHLDNFRSMWPYRDWVIDAFNANMPFDQFTIEQLAGDLLPAPTREQQIATGFNRCNPTTAEGGLIEAEYLALYAADRVETTSTVWLGPHRRLRPLPRPQVRPDFAARLLPDVAFFNSIDEDGTDRNIAAPRPVLAVPSEETNSIVKSRSTRASTTSR